MLKKPEKHSEACMFANNVWATNFNWKSTLKISWWNCSEAKILPESWDLRIYDSRTLMGKKKKNQTSLSVP